MRIARRSLGFLVALLFGAVPLAALSTVQDQSDPDLSSQFAVSSFLAADDLAIAANTRLDSVTVWLADGVANDNGLFDSFSGVLSWGIYDDAGGHPGFLHYSNTDWTPQVIDSGLQTSNGRDVFRVRIDLDGTPFVTPFGGWLVVHEGAWGTTTDGTGIGWVASATVRDSPAYVTANESDPDESEWVISTLDAAFIVESEVANWYQGSLDPADGLNISSFVPASDFSLASPQTLHSLDAWLGDLGPVNGVLDGFGGTLSWAIYSDDSGFPGTLVASGQDPTTELVPAGLQLSLTGEIFRVRIELRPSPQLPAGTFWVALHEGNWASPYDGSVVFWVRAAGVELSPSRVGTDPTNPGSWGTPSPNDLAFVLFDDEIFAAGFDAGTTCSWSAPGPGPTCP